MAWLAAHWDEIMTVLNSIGLLLVSKYNKDRQ